MENSVQFYNGEKQIHAVCFEEENEELIAFIPDSTNTVQGSLPASLSDIHSLSLSPLSLILSPLSNSLSHFQ
jgi:hypothetical protein